MVIEGGQIGFDEGGVLEALSKPFMQRETISFEYNRKGLVIKQHTDKYDVSMAHVLAAAILVLGPAALLKFNSEVLSDPAVRDTVSKVFTPKPGDVPSFFQRFLDPFNFFK